MSTNQVTVLGRASGGLRGHLISGWALPPAQLAQARDRLGRLAILFSVLWSVSLGLVAILVPFDERIPRDSFLAFLAFFAISLGMTLVLYLATRIRSLSDSHVLNLGLVYEVALCFLISYVSIWRGYVDTGFLPNATWTGLIIVIYPLIIPSPPHRTLFAALAAAATMPLSVLVLNLNGTVPYNPMDYVVMTIDPLICVAMAVFGSRVLHGMQQEVARAAELGSYRLQERLGSGGMGEVWMAEHRLLSRPAAIKVMRPQAIGGSNEDVNVLVKRFKREAQATSMMHSEHTIDLFDFGITDDGQLYYVMELLEGFDMEHLVEEWGPVRPERAIFLLRQVCHSLGEAHESGLIHRDVKPANLYVCRYGRDHDFVKVLDFGLVKGADESKLDDAKLTAANIAGGTPAYMSPEQILGHRPTDGRSDVYALGCVAYWLLTGQLVFEGTTPMETMVHHTRTQPRRPSELSEIEIPARLEEIILRCLEKDPDNRPQNIDELDKDLGEISLDEQWSEDRAREWWSVHRPTSRRSEP
jgi:tRNA A-37 threonylcarbamoyl transferase component Bud32